MHNIWSKLYIKSICILNPSHRDKSNSTISSYCFHTCWTPWAYQYIFHQRLKIWSTFFYLLRAIDSPNLNQIKKNTQNVVISSLRLCMNPVAQQTKNQPTKRRRLNSNVTKTQTFRSKWDLYVGIQVHI